MGYAVDGFIINVKELQSEECLKNAHMKYTISVENDKEQKQLQIAIRNIRKQLQEGRKKNRSRSRIQKFANKIKYIKLKS